MTEGRVRPELSQKNKYWIDRDRYYELKHFCLQYLLWKKQRAALNVLTSHSVIDVGDKSEIRPTEDLVEKFEFYDHRIKMLDQIAKKTDADLGDIILKAVTEGFSYDHMALKYDLQCSKDCYYDLYRKFFWLLDKERQ